MKSLSLPILTGIILGLLLSCSGSGGTLPDTKGGTRILGIDFGSKVPSLIAFSNLPKGQSECDLYVIYPDGTHNKRLTKTGSDEKYPRFSPDGLLLGYLGNEVNKQSWYHSIYFLKSPSKSIRLTEPDWQYEYITLDWGKDFLLTSRVNMMIGAPFDVIGLIKVSKDGKSMTPIETESISVASPVISKDGKTIAYSVRLGCPSETDPGCMGTQQIMLMDVATGKKTQLTQFGGSVEEPIWISDLAFDPQGSRIAFKTNYWGEDWEIGYLNIFSPDYMIRVTTDEGNDVEPCFDGSGNWIVFASDRDGDYDLYKVMVSDLPREIFITPGEPIRLTNMDGDEREPYWSVNY